jgi:hypothetical protein
VELETGGTLTGLLTGFVTGTLINAKKKMMLIFYKN